MRSSRLGGCCEERNVCSVKLGAACKSTRERGFMDPGIVLSEGIESWRQGYTVCRVKFVVTTGAGLSSIWVGYAAWGIRSRTVITLIEQGEKMKGHKVLTLGRAVVDLK